MNPCDGRRWREIRAGVVMMTMTVDGIDGAMTTTTAGRAIAGLANPTDNPEKLGPLLGEITPCEFSRIVSLNGLPGDLNPELLLNRSGDRRRLLEAGEASDNEGPCFSREFWHRSLSVPVRLLAAYYP
jgi:hypothetical protein